jgi:hypothetical protein
MGVNNTASSVIEANLEATLARGYKPLIWCEEYQGPVSIVGSGPSLADTYKDLVGDVIACNSAHDFLLSKGIVANMIKTLHKGIKYLIASRCHPSVFEKFKEHDVTVWHAMGGEDGLPDLLAKNQRRELLVAGGSTSVMRATHLAAVLGYSKEMHLFGIDSCYAEKESHVSGSIASQNQINIMACGKWFTVAPWMALQAEDFKIISLILRAKGVRLVVHGTGLIPYCASFLGFETPDLKVSLYEKMRREWHGLALLYQSIRNSPQLLGGSHAGI